MRNSELPLRIGGCGDLAAFYASGASVSEMAIYRQLTPVDAASVRV